MSVNVELVNKKLLKRIPSHRVLVPLNIGEWWVPGQDPNEYPVEFQRDEAWRLEHIADKLAKGQLGNRQKIYRLAKRLGCRSKFVIKVMGSPVMMARVREMIKMRALYGIAEVIGDQVEKAKSDPAAFKTLSQMGKVLEVGGGGPKVEINTTIDRRNGGDNESAVQFIERFRERSRQGLLRKVESAEVVTPEEIGESEADDSTR